MSLRLSESAVNDLEARGLGRFTTPLGFRKDGSPFYLIGGASPDDPSNDDGSGAGGNDSGGGEGGGSGSEGQSGEGGNGTGGSDANGNGETISKAEYDKLMERMRAADRNKSEAERKLKELEEKDLSEQEKIAKRLPELEKQNVELAAENQKLKAKVAFLGLDGFSWHDPDVALAQVDLSEAIDAEGNVDKKALKKAAEALAKEKTFLVKSSADDGKGGSGGGSGAGGNNGGQGSSGSNVGGGGRGSGNGGVDEASLKKKYPALNI